MVPNMSTWSFPDGFPFTKRAPRAAADAGARADSEASADAVERAEAQARAEADMRVEANMREEAGVTSAAPVEQAATLRYVPAARGAAPQVAPAARATRALGPVYPPAVGLEPEV